MKNPKQGSQTDLSFIQSTKDLRAEARRLKLEISLQEIELRRTLKSLPGETIKAGVGKILPSKLTGSLAGPLAGIAITAGSAILGGYLTKKAGAKMAGKAGASLAKTGIMAVAPVLLKMLFRKKKSDTETKV